MALRITAGALSWLVTWMGAGDGPSGQARSSRGPRGCLSSAHRGSQPPAGSWGRGGLIAPPPGGLCALMRGLSQSFLPPILLQACRLLPRHLGTPAPGGCFPCPCPLQDERIHESGGGESHRTLRGHLCAGTVLGCRLQWRSAQADPCCLHPEGWSTSRPQTQGPTGDPVARHLTQACGVQGPGAANGSSVAQVLEDAKSPLHPHTNCGQILLV